MSVEETKRLIVGVTSRLETLSTQLDGAKARFSDAARQADDVLRGSSTGVQQQVVQAIRAAESSLMQASESITRAGEAGRSWISSH